MINTQKIAGIIWERSKRANYELFYCTEDKHFYMTQLTFNITSKISKTAALELCQNSGWDADDYMSYFS